MIRVLVVEDSPIIRRGVIQGLNSSEEIEIVGCAEGIEEAVDKASKLKPDVVLMDLKLGENEKAGIVATKRIKDVLSNTKVVVFTSYDDEKHILEAMDAQVDGYMLKDTPREKLIEAIKSASQGKSVMHPTVAERINYVNEKNDKERGRQRIKKLLSSEEMGVFKLITFGFTNKEIANKTSLSEAEVKNCISSILKKLGVTSRVQAAIVALNLDLFSD